jgi:hypothetical protein
MSTPTEREAVQRKMTALGGGDFNGCTNKDLKKATDNDEKRQSSELRDLIIP